MTEIKNIHKNILGTASFELKLDNMRKFQEFSVYPMADTAEGKTIKIQSGTRIGTINLETGAGELSQSHANGAYFHHLNFDKLTGFELSQVDLSALKMFIFTTAGEKVGRSYVHSDNSGALRVL